MNTKIAQTSEVRFVLVHNHVYFIMSC